MKDIIIFALIIIMVCAVSWAITLGLVYLICLCFSWEFNWLIATGIWLATLLLKGAIGGGNNK